MERTDQKIMDKIAYGLFVLTGALDGRESGSIINTAIQVTTQPNRISITAGKRSFTQELVRKSGRFNLSILSEDAPFALYRRFGLQSGRDVDKFSGYSGCRRASNGLYYVTEGANAYLSAAVEQTLDLGSHTLFIARVEELAALSDAPSATYDYYRTFIKPQDEAPAKKGGWRCVVCGYVYEGEDLPEDFICPLCGHGASDFEPVSQ